MDTIKQSKVFATVSLMLGLLVSGTAGWAGPSSVLDPYVEVAAPTGRAAKQQKALLPESTAVQTSTTYVNMDTDKPTVTRVKKPHFSMGGHTVKPEKQTVAKTKVEKVKAAKVDTQKVQTKKTAVSSGHDDGLAGGTKTKLVDGTKSIGDGITSGAKASGSLFMKGAKVIGGGFKGADDKKESKSDDSKKKAKPLPDPKLGEETKSSSDSKLVAEKKKDDAKKDDKKKDDKKKSGSGVLSPISNIFKGTGYEIKDTLHAATDKLSITKPKAGKDSAAERIAEDHNKKSKSGKSETESSYVAKGKPVKKSSDGNGLVSKTFGKLPFIGGKKNSDQSQENKIARTSDPDGVLTDEEAPRKTADKSETPLGGSL